MTTTTLNTGAELFRQIGYLADDENSLRKVLAYVRKLVAKREEAAEGQQPVMTRHEVENDLKEALKELKEHKVGKQNFSTWEEFRHELQEEGYFD